MREVFPQELTETFGIDDLGMIAEGKRASFILIDGRPDENIKDLSKIKQVWVDGKIIY